MFWKSYSTWVVTAIRPSSPNSASTWNSLNHVSSSACAGAAAHTRTKLSRTVRAIAAATFAGFPRGWTRVFIRSLLGTHATLGQPGSAGEFARNERPPATGLPAAAPAATHAAAGTTPAAAEGRAPRRPGGRDDLRRHRRRVLHGRQCGGEVDRRDLLGQVPIRRPTGADPRGRAVVLPDLR